MTTVNGPNRIPLPGDRNVLLKRLADIVVRLYGETPDFVDHPEDAQAWYNRGYANGVIAALDRHGCVAVLEGRVNPDPPDVAEPYRVFDWGKAYVHGVEKGFSEAQDVLSGPEFPTDSGGVDH